MGEVYHARDARLGRDVAIKVLSETVMNDPSRLARFDRGEPAGRRITDRSTFMARWVSWSPDGQHLVAAVAETDVDVVLLDGLL
jgi:serine/threonine protein kinase